MGINVSDLRDIVYEIFDEEKVTSMDVFPVTMSEYYRYFVLNRRYNYSLFPIINGVDGINDINNGNIIIILDRFRNSSNFVDFIETCYHEVRHSQQYKFNYFSYERFLLDIEKFILNNSFFSRFNYAFCENNFSFEIGANLYGIRKTKEYFQKNNPMYYERKKNYIENKELEYEIDYFSYDVNSVFNKLISVLRNSNCYVKDVSPVLAVFMDNDYKFRSFHDIFNDARFKRIDPKIVYSIVSSDIFIDNLNFNSLNKEELAYVKDCIVYGRRVQFNKDFMVKKLELK